jgi:hypothetical protein
MECSRILLVEGTAGVGKSTLLDALVRQYVSTCPPRRLRTLLHLTQAHTYGPLAPGEDSGTLTIADNMRHLDQVAATLEWCSNALTSESTPKFFALIDTLHLTHCHRPGVVAWSDVATADARLAQLGTRLVFLAASPETIWRRGILPRAEESFIRDYARRRFGPTLEEIHRYFVAEQARMRALLDQSRLPYLVLDAHADMVSNVARATEFWLA